MAGEDDLKAAILRAVSCAFNFEGMKWHHTYWDEQNGAAYCLYEAQDSNQLRDHADRARVPCDDVWPVAVVTPEDLLTAPGVLAVSADPESDDIKEPPKTTLTT
jgi:hypothetical protein